MKEKVDHSKNVFDNAIKRLTKINTGFSEKPWEKFDDEGEYVRVCMVLCDYLKVEPKFPAKDIADKFNNLAEEMLYLSGIRYKDVSLPDEWWKHDNGAMLGNLQDGTFVALLPGRLSGYKAYDPKHGVFYKVDAAAAKKIKPQATAVFRTFPAKKIGIKDVISFIMGENLYREIAVILIYSFLASIIHMLPPMISAQIFDVIVPENRRMVMYEIFFVLVAFAFANVGFSILVNLGISRINTKSALAVQAALWDRLLSLRIPFFNQYTAGELQQKIRSIEHVQKLISMQTLQAVLSNMFVFVYIIVLYNFNAAITPYVLFMFLILLSINAVAGRMKYTLYKRHTDLENKVTSFNHQCIRAVHRIKVSGAEERVFNMWSVYETDKRKVKSKIKIIDDALESFQYFFLFISTAVVYFLFAFTQDVGIGVFIAYSSTLLIFQRSAKNLLKALGILPELIALCANVKPILDAIPEYDARKIIPKDMRGTLEVNNASFRFSQYGQNILNDISFRIEEGESLGILGGSGEGKSTLIKLLMGFYELTGGKIYFGGYDLETIDMRYLRKQMGAVLQDSRLVVGDIYNNITGNDNTVGHEAVMNAIRKVGLEEKINALPNGIHTNLEQSLLSEGERQKLLIARAIAKKNKFIFLDEATGNLDNTSQNIILKNLKDIPATKIIVAQQASVVQYCDKIIVIDSGKIAMRGTYTEIADKVYDRHYISSKNLYQ